jgi:nucleoside-diphosphate-sugar epimerase
MRVVVTGARGFIGRHSVAELVALGHEVHGVTSSSAPGAKDVTWHRADLLAGEGAAVLRDVRPDVLVHLAWVTIPGAFWADPSNDAWLAASRTLVDEFVAGGGKRVVVAGTCAEYDWSGGVCDEATTPLRPSTLYGRRKDELRAHVERTAAAAGVSWAWGRVFWLYGPGEPLPRLVPSIIASLLRDEPALCTEGTQRRDFLHVADVGAAMARLAASGVAGAVNIASGDAVAVADVARKIGELMGKPSLVRLGARPSPSGDPPLVVAATRRLRDEVGFAPRWDLTSGLEQTIAAMGAAMRAGGA